MPVISTAKDSLIVIIEQNASMNEDLSIKTKDCIFDTLLLIPS